MARTPKDIEDLKDRFWSFIEDEITNQLNHVDCLDSAFCEGLAEEVVYSVSEKTDSMVEELLFVEDEDADALPLLETIRTRYFNMLDAVEQRELERLLRLLRP